MSSTDTAITGHTMSLGGATAPPAPFSALRASGLANLLVTGGVREERERIARTFHDSSRIRGGPFVSADATRPSWPALLLRALSGSLHQDPDDDFRRSDGGTLFLDGVDRLSHECQRLLLEFLLRGRSESARDGRWAGRIVAGSGTDLRALVARGRFLAPLHDTLDKLHVDLGLPS